MPALVLVLVLPMGLVMGLVRSDERVLLLLPALPFDFDFDFDFDCFELGFRFVAT